MARHSSTANTDDIGGNQADESRTFESELMEFEEDVIIPASSDVAGETGKVSTEEGVVPTTTNTEECENDRKRYSSPYGETKGTVNYC